MNELNLCVKSKIVQQPPGKKNKINVFGKNSKIDKQSKYFFGFVLIKIKSNLFLFYFFFRFLTLVSAMYTYWLK